MKKIKANSTNHHNRETLDAVCLEAYALSLIGSRWKLAIFYMLKKRTMRFSELRDLIPNITERMLALHLKELEKDMLVNRTVYAEVPARVEYSLTEMGLALAPVWDFLRAWGRKHKEMVDATESVPSC